MISNHVSFFSPLNDFKCVLIGVLKFSCVLDCVCVCDHVQTFMKETTKEGSPNHKPSLKPSHLVSAEEHEWFEVVPLRF